MKKWWKLILSVMLAMLAVCPAALAADDDPVPQTERQSTVYTMEKVDLSDSVFMFGSFRGPQTLPGEAQLLGAEESAGYQHICDGIRETKDEIIFDGWSLPVTQEGVDTLKALVSKVLNDHPEFFYVGKEYFPLALDSNIVGVSFSYFDLKLRDDLDAEVNRIVREVLDDRMTSLEKLLILHDYIALNCQYDFKVCNNLEGESPRVYNAYGALVEHNAVCQGYAEAYMLLIKKAGLAGVDIGLVSSRKMNHAWNWVSINGRKYHTDVTGDDPVYGSNNKLHDRPGYCQHKYFLRSSDGMIKTVGDQNVTYWGYSTEFYFEDTEYQEGYLFSNSNTPFFWYDGDVYYLDENDVKKANEDLKGTITNPSRQRVALRWGDHLYYLDSTNYRGHRIPVYHYYFPDQTREDHIDDSPLEVQDGQTLGMCVNETKTKLQVVKLNGADLTELYAIDLPQLDPAPTPTPACSTDYYDCYLEDGVLKVTAKKAGANVFMALFNNDHFTAVKIVTPSSPLTCQLNANQSAKVMAMDQHFKPQCKAYTIPQASTMP